MNKPRTVMVNGQECLVQSLREWLNDRITQLRQAKRLAEDDVQEANAAGRLVELLIVREKINDGRIQGIEA